MDDLVASWGPTIAYYFGFSVGLIIAVGATIFLPTIALATVRWARSLIDGGAPFDEDDDYDRDDYEYRTKTGRWAE